MMFPYSDPFEFAGHQVSVDWVEKNLTKQLTEKRLDRINKVVAARTYSVTVVLEDIYDRGNSSAVMRSCEAMGIQSVHHIELNDRFKVANRVASGADKWLDQYKYATSKEAIDTLKNKGYQLVATDLRSSVPISEVDFSIPTALVLGNEKDGITQEMSQAADFRVVVPMDGFVESYNISVAAALALYHIRQNRISQLGSHGDLTDEQVKILKSIYICKSKRELTVAILNDTNSRN